MVATERRNSTGMNVLVPCRLYRIGMGRVREKRMRVLPKIRRAENADVASVVQAPVLTSVAHLCQFRLSRIPCEERCCHWLLGQLSTSLSTLWGRLISSSFPCFLFQSSFETSL